jgi:predicted amino acid racemase
MEESVKKLIPYSVYLPIDYHEKIRLLAKQRKASALIRDAICMMLDGGNQYQSGYNQAIRDVTKTIKKISEIKDISFKGIGLDEIITEQVKQLEMQ